MGMLWIPFLRYAKNLQGQIFDMQGQLTKHLRQLNMDITGRHDPEVVCRSIMKLNRECDRVLAALEVRKLEWSSAIIPKDLF